LKISINFKILFLTISIIVATLGYFIYHSLKIQSQEKINQEYQMQLNETKLLGLNFSQFIDTGLNTLRQAGSLDWKNPEAHKVSLSAILNNQKEIDRIYIFSIKKENGTINLIHKSSNKFGDIEEDLAKNNIAEKFDEIINEGQGLFDMSGETAVSKMGIVLSDAKFDELGSEVLVVVGLLNLDNVFTQSNYTIELIGYQGELLYTSDFSNISSKKYQKNLYKKAKQSKSVNAIIEFEESNQNFLGGYYQIKKDVFFLTSQPMIKIISSVYFNTQKMILLGLMALFVGIWFTIQVAKSVSAPIIILTKATEKIAAGNFDVKMPKSSNDEIGQLSSSFDFMLKKIKKLLKEQVEKIRLESEMNIAATVQKTLFPEELIDNDVFKITSHYSPASECGGDLWGFFTNKSKMYFIIADATGHGLPSALITVSAKSTMSLMKRLLEKNIEISPSELLSYANRAVFETSQGKIMMTAFCGVIDFEDMSITYANAGHNPPWVFSENGGVTSLSSAGTRLGESSEQVSYKEKKYDLKVNDKIFLYTDGIVENTNKKGEMFDKKNVRKLMAESIKNNRGITPLINEFKKFLGSKTLDDDTTVVLIEPKKFFSKEEAA